MMDKLVSDPSSPYSMCLVSVVKEPPPTLREVGEVTVSDVLLAVLHFKPITGSVIKPHWCGTGRNNGNTT